MISQHYLLANSLEGVRQNHEVISQNLANVNTPGYQTRQLNFAEFRQQIEDGTADQQMLRKVPVELVQGLQNRKDENNVNLDSQLGALKKNSLLFQTYSQLLSSKMATARRAMSR
ncbi:MAG: flagellar basal body protein [Planctomycetota bacterium]